MRVGDDGRRAACKDEPCILCRGEERTLDMNMGIDQPRYDAGAGEVVPPLPPVISYADDVAVLHREVRAFPGACKGVEDYAAGEDGIS